MLELLAPRPCIASAHWTRACAWMRPSAPRRAERRPSIRRWLVNPQVMEELRQAIVADPEAMEQLKGCSVLVGGWVGGWGGRGGLMCVVLLFFISLWREGSPQVNLISALISNLPTPLLPACP